jgi:hypothetical protein
LLGGFRDGIGILDIHERRAFDCHFRRGGTFDLRNCN